jgi:hypothetical protein
MTETPFDLPFTTNNTSPQVRAPAHLTWYKLGKSISSKLLALPLLAFIAVPLIALFLRTSPANFLANLNQAQVIQAINLSLLTTLTLAVILVCFSFPTLIVVKGILHCRLDLTLETSPT